MYADEQIICEGGQPRTYTHTHTQGSSFRYSSSHILLRAEYFSSKSFENNKYAVETFWLSSKTVGTEKARNGKTAECVHCYLLLFKTRAPSR